MPGLCCCVDCKGHWKGLVVEDVKALVLDMLPGRASDHRTVAHGHSGGSLGSKRGEYHSSPVEE